MAPTTRGKKDVVVPVSKIELPGLNLPLNHKVQGLFPSPLDDADLEGGRCALPIMTLRELSMLHIINSITDKPGWEVKVFDDEISNKWKSEAIATEGADVTEKMMDYVIAELRWKAKIFNDTGAVVLYNGHVVKADNMIPEQLKLALRTAVQPLENVPEVHKDYHPRSDQQVLDLVHPSLFPLIYGRSRVLKDRTIGLSDSIDSIGKGDVVPIRDDKETEIVKQHIHYYGYHNTKPYSKNFQWLPCDVRLRDGNAEIVSYINNLHPQKHQDLYSAIGKIITKVIPLWNLTLAEPLKEDELRIKFELAFDPDPENIDEEDRPPQRDDEDEDEYWDRMQQWEEDVRKTVLPEPGEFSPLSEDGHSDYDILKWSDKAGIQVIVKLANIELTPEKPEYAGGTWHVEGQLNEHICATALYYYDNENITDSHLAFRQQADHEAVGEIPYPQSVHGWLTDVFGFQNDEAAIQNVGSILCREDRLITFPNRLQHQVQSFKLADTSKPGHRKILALFLVDPGIRIIGTANVPPQQRDWWSEKINEQFSRTEVALGSLSTELKDKIFADVDDFPIGLDEAKEIRLKLMDERKQFVSMSNQSFVTNTFSLCEH